MEVERLVIEKSDIAKGIIQLILENGITTLVMGAAADKNYSKYETLLTNPLVFFHLLE